MKAAEAYFLLAEAKLRWDIGSESVKNLYENGIHVSMTNELAYRGAYAGIKEYPEGAVDAYINGTSTQIDYTDPIKAELSTPAVNKLSVNGMRAQATKKNWKESSPKNGSPYSPYPPKAGQNNAAPAIHASFLHSSMKVMEP